MLNIQSVSQARFGRFYRFDGNNTELKGYLQQQAQAKKGAIVEAQGNAYYIDDFPMSKEEGFFAGITEFHWSQFKDRCGLTSGQFFQDQWVQQGQLQPPFDSLMVQKVLIDTIQTIKKQFVLQRRHHEIRTRAEDLNNLFRLESIEAAQQRLSAR